MKRSILGDVQVRVPVGGRIRAGMKILKRSAAQKPLVKQIYDEGLAQGLNFDEIEDRLLKEANEKGALIPTNVPWFTVRRAEFHVPAIADEIIAKYGETRPEHPHEKRLYAFPVVLATDNWLDVLPHTFVHREGSEARHWADYDPEGVRRCYTHAPVHFDPKSQRKQFPRREIVLRKENDGLCNPETCVEYSKGLCRLRGFVRFYVYGVKGMFLFEIPTSSFYSLTGARAKLEEVRHVRGRISGLQNGKPLLWLTKQRREISRYSLEHQRYVREKQWLIVFEVLDHGVESVLQGAEDGSQHPLLAQAQQARAGTPASEEAASKPASDASAEPLDPIERLKALRRELFDLVQARGVAVERFSARNTAMHGEGWSKDERSLAVLLEEARQCPAADYPDLIEEGRREGAGAESCG
jgi:hypothetical protein